MAIGNEKVIEANDKKVRIYTSLRLVEKCLEVRKGTHINLVECKLTKISRFEKVHTNNRFIILDMLYKTQFLCIFKDFCHDSSHSTIYQ